MEEGEGYKFGRTGGKEWGEVEGDSLVEWGGGGGGEGYKFGRIGGKEWGEVEGDSLVEWVERGGGGGGGGLQIW